MMCGIYCRTIYRVVANARETEFLRRSYLVLMMLVWDPYFGNHWISDLGDQFTDYNLWTLHTCMLGHFSYLTLCNPMDRLLCPWDSPGKNSGVVAMPSSRGSSRPRDKTRVSFVSCIGSWVLYH